MTEGGLRCMVVARVLRRWLVFTDWIKPTYSEEAWPDEPGVEERNINYFTCLVSTVDIRGALLKSDV